MNSAAIAFVQEQVTGKKKFPKFKAGDNITVNYKILEGTKERIQSFKGDVLKLQGTGATTSFTVRKISDGIGDLFFGLGIWIYINDIRTNFSTCNFFD